MNVDIDIGRLAIVIVIILLLIGIFSASLVLEKKNNQIETLQNDLNIKIIETKGEEGYVTSGSLELRLVCPVCKEKIEVVEILVRKNGNGVL